MSLTTETKDDIDKSFDRLISVELLQNEKETLSKAKTYLNDHLTREYSESIKAGLKLGSDLIKQYKEIDSKEKKKVILAALEYLIDPWDIIPDFIAEKGFLDDIYVLNKAHTFVKDKEIAVNTTQSNRNSPEEWFLYKIGGASGPHLAKRAKQLNILNSYQRKALFDIGRKNLYGYEMSRKQLSFFDTLVEKVVNEGVLNKKCPDAPCEYCDKLKKVYKSN